MTIDPKNLSATATITFDDEFNSLSLWNGTSGTWDPYYPWEAATGGNNAANNELEWYINPNYGPTNSVNPFSVSNGILTIQAAPASPAIQSITGEPYTSGIITTYHSFAQTYGYFEMRAEMPTGQGIWPAFWLLPTDESWPPEIDVMELIGSEPNNLYNFVHYGNDQVVDGVSSVAGMTTGFHTYGVDWERDFITWYYDGNVVSRVATPPGVDKPMYMLVDLAVGGDWPGSPNATTHFPANLLIDYVRAYAALPSAVQRPFDLPTTPPTSHMIIGTSGNNVLTASSPDTYFDTWGGNDTINGLGNDIIELYTSKTVINEPATQAGINTVLSGSTSFTLPNNVQNITLIGNGGNHARGSQTAIGNSLDNLMISNSTKYGNTLSGGAGNDELVAGNGPDTLTGGTGSDEFVFKALPSRAGHITDFTVGTDLLDLRGIFQTAGYKGSDPLSDHHLILTANSAGGTTVYFDPSGNLSAAKYAITTLDHVAPSSLHLQSDIWFA